MILTQGQHFKSTNAMILYLDSITYTFGPLGGQITFTFSDAERPDTKTDQLSFGFSTGQLDGLLVRISSATSNDFIDIELVGSNFFLFNNLMKEETFSVWLLGFVSPLKVFKGYFL